MLQPLPLGATRPRSLLLRCRGTVATVTKESLKGALPPASTSRCHLSCVQRQTGMGPFRVCRGAQVWRPTSVRACPRPHCRKIYPRPGPRISTVGSPPSSLQIQAIQAQLQLKPLWPKPIFCWRSVHHTNLVHPVSCSYLPTPLNGP